VRYIYLVCRILYIEQETFTPPICHGKSEPCRVGPTEKVLSQVTVSRGRSSSAVLGRGERKDEQMPSSSYQWIRQRWWHTTRRPSRRRQSVFQLVLANDPMKVGMRLPRVVPPHLQCHEHKKVRCLRETLMAVTRKSPYVFSVPRYIIWYIVIINMQLMRLRTFIYWQNSF